MVFREDEVGEKVLWRRQEVAIGKRGGAALKKEVAGVGKRNRAMGSLSGRKRPQQNGAVCNPLPL